MLQLKNVREVVREGNDEPTGVVVTQVIDDQKFIVYASTSKLCQLKYRVFFFAGPPLKITSFSR